MTVYGADSAGTSELHNPDREWPLLRLAVWGFNETLRAPVRHAAVDVTPLISLRENAIAKEPGLRYAERWRCVT